ncbi:MAG: class I SAM-dependent methyltransferase [Desulfomonilaceae bacterium]
MDRSTIRYYDENSEKLAALYEQADMSIAHGLLVRFLPENASVLEIGCGSGRDAAFLLSKGYDMAAIEASPKMIEAAQRLHPELTGRIALGALPLPDSDPLLTRQFDAVLCIGTIIHIQDQYLFEFASQMRDLVAPDGILFLSGSVRNLGSPDNRDQHGRLIIERVPEEIQLLFERLGFRLLTTIQSDDSLGRPIRWFNLVMQKVGQGNSRSIDEIETIISRDKKDATYKLALLRALCDIARTDLGMVRWGLDGNVRVSLGSIVEKWILYYWPIIELDGPDRKVVIPQKRGMERRVPIAFRKAMRDLIAFYRNQGGLTVWHRDYKSDAVPAEGKPLVDGVVNKIAHTIVVGPVRYSGGSLALVEQYFSFEGKQTATGGCFSSMSACDRLGSVVVRGKAWMEMCVIGHWIGESLIVRWAELTHEISNQLVEVKDVIERLLIRPAEGRDVGFARKIYSKEADLRCVWTGASLEKGFVVDHAIPFSVWRSNDLWNVFPAATKVNSAKSDKLISKRALLSSRDRIIHYWETLKQQAENRFVMELGRSLVGSPGYDPGNWQAPAFAGLVRNVETLAMQRGLMRWEP